MFQWKNPQYLIFIFLVVVLYFVTLIYLQRRQKGYLRFIDLRIWDYLTASSHLVPRRKLKIFLQSLALVFFVLALARPQMGQRKETVKAEGIEILLMLDVSDSMMSEDVKPNRLEQMKLEMNKLVDKLPGHKVGIIAFAGSANLLCPLTTDPNALKMYIDSLSPLIVSSQGTEFKNALGLALNAFEKGGVDGASDRPVTQRLIIIASDGEDHEPEALAEAKKLTEKNIRIMTLAYGTETGGQIPERDNYGFLKGYKKNRSGETVISKVNPDVMKELADAGRGIFQKASFGGNHIEQLVNAVNQLEKTQFDSQVITDFDEKFQFLLFFGILLALLEVLLREKKVEDPNRKKEWKGRFELSGLLILFLFAGLLTAHKAEAYEGRETYEVYSLNRQAIASLKEKNLSDSLLYTKKALSANPESATLYNNLGVIYFLMNRADEALVSFEKARDRAVTATERFISYFNLGFYYQKQKKYDEALDSYQKGLFINPESNETRINIELMIQQQQQDQQQSQGEGGEQGDQKKDSQNQKSDKNDKDQKSDSNSDKEQNKGDEKDQKDKSDKDQSNDKDGKNYAKNPPPKVPQKPQFKSEELSQGDAQKILGEIGQQEQRIRGEYQKRERKERDRDKDW